jgi:Cu(I)/Ag(I) efflux system membrane fusion protein
MFSLMTFGMTALCVVMDLSCSAPVIDHAKKDDVDSVALSILARSPGTVVLSQQSVVRFGTTVPGDDIAAKGMIIPDDSRTNTIAARSGGRIEKLYIHQPYQFVKKGEKLLDLYSPDLNTAISEYLFVWNKDSTSSLTQSARKKLVLLGLEEFQLRSIEKNNSVPPAISLYSPYAGYVISSGAATNSTGNSSMENNSSAMNGMNAAGSNKDNIISPASSIKEGAYIVPGQVLFSVNDAQQVIALLNVDAADQSSVQEGLEVVVTSETQNNSSIKGTINLVEPEFRNGQHSLSVRVGLDNSNGLLKFNSLVNAEIDVASTTAASLPSSCIFDLGERKIVWVKTGEAGHVPYFTPRVITSGNSFGNYTEILSGIDPGEEVALQAGLMVDRDGIIQTDTK